MNKPIVRKYTHEFLIGNIAFGGQNPIRLQSMTNTNTMDEEATANQCIRIAESGADMVRITAQNVKTSEKLKTIKKILTDKGYSVPIAADIHFSPKAALKAAEYVEKVRINPGNFSDTKKFKQLQYSDEQYAGELQNLKEKFLPLLDICKKYKRAIRIGTNHGSLSDRIMSRYGDTPKGMVESTMEFLRICQSENFHKVVVSMKSGNPLIMVETNRLLVKTMESENMHYPIHLGVTEAGEGEDGRIKSAVGIATVLADGIGDTIRVSLTEDPEKEIPVARTLKEIMELPVGKKNQAISGQFEVTHEKRISRSVKTIGKENTPIVIADLRHQKLSIQSIINAGFSYRKESGEFQKSDTSADCILVNSDKLPGKLPEDVIVATDGAHPAKNKAGIIPLSKARQIEENNPKLYFAELTVDELKTVNPEQFRNKNIVLIANINSGPEKPIYNGREILRYVKENKIQNPLIWQMKFSDNAPDFIIKASAGIGGLMIDYGADGILINSDTEYKAEYNTLGFGILQACRLRISKTEYISCPSCGRTLFDLQKTTAEVKKKTAHLKGLKIAVMGCIVNGPGEMADADYGYVGFGKGKVNLYKKKSVVKKNISQENAVDELLKFIEFDLNQKK